MTPGSILFITRNYPPKVGGLEKYSFNLIEAFKSSIETHQITLSKSKKHLVWFFPYSLLKAIYFIRRFSIPHVHLCDGLLAPVGVLLKYLTGTTVTATVHGLDITYGNPMYQKVIPPCTQKLDGIICVSRSTRQEVLKRTSISSENCVVIPNGIMADEMVLFQTKAQLLRTFEHLTHLSLSNRKILFTLGHLVKRKGVAWFTANVMPKLPKAYIYLIAGEGPERDRIEKIIAYHRLARRVFLLGEVSDEIRRILYNVSDIFVMSNTTVPGDVEGFGIVAIEAGSAGLPVVASNIQGIRDAVIHKNTGLLIEEGDVEGFVRGIRGMNLKRSNIRNIVNETFGWEKLIAKYRSFLFS